MRKIVEWFDLPHHPEPALREPQGLELVEMVDGRRRTQAVRWSEAIERNEGYESFSAAC